MVSLYRTRHVQADIPIDILTGSLHDELIFERNNCKFDKFAGNRMRIINNGKLIATAGGQTGSTLCKILLI